MAASSFLGVVGLGSSLAKRPTCRVFGEVDGQSFSEAWLSAIGSLWDARTMSRRYQRLL